MGGSYQLQYYSYRWMAVQERYLLKGSISFREGQIRSIRKKCHVVAGCSFRSISLQGSSIIGGKISTSILFIPVDGSKREVSSKGKYEIPRRSDAKHPDNRVTQVTEY